MTVDPKILVPQLEEVIEELNRVRLNLKSPNSNPAAYRLILSKKMMDLKRIIKQI